MSDVRPATLVLDQSAASLAAVRPWCLPRRIWCTTGEAPTVGVHVRDKTGAWPLNGVFARLERGLTSPGPGLDPKTHITAAFNGANVEDIFASPAIGERDVAAHGQASITLVFKDLPVGEHAFPLRFTATNSGDDDAQRLTVAVKMRNSVLGAVLVLVLGAAVSFISIRVVAMLRRRAVFLQRLRTMRPAWLAEEPPILPVIGLRAALRQAEDLSRRSGDRASGGVAAG
jgi:hypothetical protein